jgi:glutathione synthase/RimK-type ligase-like ATP-grasp enzyme
MGLFCIQNNIPYFHTYFKTDGNYLNREILKEYPIIMKEYSGINRVEILDGKEKVKKNVFKIDSIDGFKQENLSDQDHSKFFIQEFSDIGQDIRLFVQKEKVIAGWKRNNTDSFMTVSHGEYTLYNTPIDSERVLTEKVAQLLEADFMAVDIMYIHDTPHLQEISFHPGFKAYETKIEGNTINIGKAIVEGF